MKWASKILNPFIQTAKLFRQRAKESQRKSEARFQLLFTANPLPMWVYDLETFQFLEVNDAAVAHYGYSHDEFLRLRLMDIRPAEDLGLLNENLAQKRSSLEASGPWRRKLKDGRIINVQITSHSIDWVGRRAALVVAQDITERVQAEEALRRSEAYLNAAQKLGHTGHWAFNLTSGELHWSQETFRIFGFEPAETKVSLQENFLARIHPEDRPIIEAGLAAASTQRESFEVDYRIVLPGGSIRNIREIVFPVVDATQKISERIGVIIDVTERRRAEAENARLAAIVNSSDDAIFSDTREGIITTWNAGAERMYGYSADEIKGKHFSVLVPEDRRGSQPANRERLLRGEAIVHYATEHMRKDGSRLQVSLTISPMKDGAGVVTGLSVISRDITERKRVEQSQRESEERFRATFENAGIGMALVDLQGHPIKTNAALRQMLGYSEEEFNRMAFTEFTHPDDREMDWGLYRQLAAGEFEKYELEKRFLKKGGGVVWGMLTVTVVKDPQGLPMHAVSMVQDISKHKHAEEELLEEKHLLHTIMDNLPDAIYFKDRDSRFTRINMAIAKNFGLSDPAGAIGKTDSDFFSAEHAQAAYKDELEIMLTGRALVDQVERETWPDGRVTWASTTKMPLRDAKGNITGTFGVSRDFTQRKQMEEELALKTALLEAQAETTIDGILVVDTTEQVLLVNKQFARMWRFPEEIIHTKDDRVLLAHVRDRVKDPEAFMERVQHLYTHQTETSRDEIELRDGRVFDRYSSPLRDATGMLYGRIWYFRDISERKRAEMAVLASEERYRALFENSPVGIYRTSPGGRVLAANPALVKMLGYSSFEELATRDLNAGGFGPEYPRSRFMELIEKQGEVAGLEASWHRLDGGVLQVRENARVIRDDSGQILCYEGTVEDVTQFNRTQAEHSRLVTAVEQSSDAVVITSPSGRIEYVNQAFTVITGYSREEAVGKNPRILKSGQQDTEFYQKLWSTIRGGEPWRGEIINRRKDGTFYVESMHISPVRGACGEVTHFIATSQDITIRRHLENQLIQAQKMEAVGRLAGGVAHDFNNLLTIINGYASLLVSETPCADPRRDQLNEIVTAGERAATLTRQLLAFSRRQVLAPRVLDLNGVIVDIEKMLRRLIGEDVDLVTSLGPNLGSIRVDPGQIEQVVMNLAVNARDAIPKGGKLSIETSNVDVDADYARQHANITPGKYVMMAVSDNGCGMDTETQSHIFEPFFTTKGKAGTGLGLATVYGIIKQSGGFIWVYSEPGQGSTFKIYFPWVEKAESPQAPVKDESETSNGWETIMVVEDEKGVRRLACDTLRSNGYNVLEAGGASLAMAIAEEYKEPIHLLLTDVVMPQTGGKELSKLFSSLHPETRVLFMSGYTDDAVVRHGILQGDTPFLQKPFTPGSLGRKVREVLKMIRQR